MFKQMTLIFVFNLIIFKKQQQSYVIFLKYANRFRKSASFSAVGVLLFCVLHTPHVFFSKVLFPQSTHARAREH